MSKNKLSGLETLALLSQLGFSVALPVAGGVVLGNMADRKFNTGNIFLLVFTVLGVLAGFYSAYRLVVISTKKDK